MTEILELKSWHSFSYVVQRIGCKWYPKRRGYKWYLQEVLDANGIQSVEGTNGTCKKIGGCRGGFGKYFLICQRRGYGPSTSVSSQERHDFFAATPLSFP